MFFLSFLTLLIHHYLIHGYLFDLHDIKYLKIESHEFWEFIFFILSLMMLYLSNFVKIETNVTKKVIVMIVSTLIVLSTFTMLIT